MYHRESFMLEVSVESVAQTGLFRPQLIRLLSRLRYPQIDKFDQIFNPAPQIDPTTLWLWCDLVGVRTGLDWFSEQECVQLGAIALWLMTGRKKRDFLALSESELYQLHSITAQKIHQLDRRICDYD
ncbi:hypothetical protein H6F43_03625 [Leptolyngbya sp. FACHB-36]|nr:hypothetical protein [Leptolyngbya sp. FACHB-36]